MRRTRLGVAVAMAAATLLSLTAVATATPAANDLTAVATATPAANDLTAVATATPSANDLPPGCENHWKTPDIRVRHATRDTYLHTMSNRNPDGSGCDPNGPLIGTVTNTSEFHLYFSDPYKTYWCYGYYPRLSHAGWILCDALGA